MTTCIMYLDKDFVHTCSDKRTSLSDEYIESDQSVKTVISDRQIFLCSGCPSVRHHIKQEIDSCGERVFTKQELKELTGAAGDTEILVYNRQEDTVWQIADGKDMPVQYGVDFYAIGSGQMLARAAFLGLTDKHLLKRIIKIVASLHLFTSPESDYNAFTRITK